MDSEQSTKVLLIGGTSHVGKSTLAQRLADEWGWNCLSTDQLARHPGRPWGNEKSAVPQDVVAHYSALSTGGLLDSVLQHYQGNVWPIVNAVVRSHLNNPFEPCLVLEGSALLPDLVAAAGFERTKTIWLTAPAEMIKQRIHESSGFEDRPNDQRRLIDAFLERTLAFDRLFVETVERLGESAFDASTTPELLQPL